VEVLKYGVGYSPIKHWKGTCICGNCRSTLMVYERDLRRHFGLDLSFSAHIDAATFLCCVCEKRNLLDISSSMCAKLPLIANRPTCRCSPVYRQEV
jgi:hypothetical protein